MHMVLYMVWAGTLIDSKNVQIILYPYFSDNFGSFHVKYISRSL